MTARVYVNLPEGNSLLFNMAIEIVDLPSYKTGIFHGYVVCLPEGKTTKKFAMLLLSLRDLPCALSQWLQRLMTVYTSQSEMGKAYSDYF
jgi:hypothetical protein